MSDAIRARARLKMLAALADEVDETSNSIFLQEDLAGRWRINRSHAWVRDELRYLETMGAVTIVAAGEALVATLTEKGRDHLAKLVAIEGVAKPSESF